MIYDKEVNDFELALRLEASQTHKIKAAISKAYNQEWHTDGPNVDQIYASIAPILNTPEEAFYAASVILTDIFQAMKN